MLKSPLKSLSKTTESLLNVQLRSFAVSKKLDVTPDTLRLSGSRMLDYYTNIQLPTGQLEGLTDSCHYCKLPHALVLGGRIDEADRMLDYCVNNFLQENGDFMNIKTNKNEIFNAKEKTLHWEFADFYPYLNQWWITCGVRLNRFDFIYKAYNYVDKYWYNPNTNAALVQDPLNNNRKGRNENCTFCSAHLGLTYLYLNNITKAIGIGDAIIKSVNMQDELDKNIFYQRFDDNFNLFKSFDSDDDGVKNAAIINGNNEYQCWWSLGYPAAYTASLYIATGNKKYLDCSEKILNFTANNCNDNIRNNIVSHKVMWAASLVGNLTGKKLYWDLCKDIANHIINVGQTEDGRVLNWQWEKGTEYGEAQVIDQTGEIAYWLFVVARQMEKAKLNGTLN